MSVYAAINKVQAALAEKGITKSRKNATQGYQFRGIDDIYNEVSSVMAEHGLCVFPIYDSRECIERQSAGGKPIFYTTVRGVFEFVSALDGSKHIAVTYGESMDSADKSTNKAMSAALKYCLMQTLLIPTEGDNDADAHTPQLASAAPARPAAAPGGKTVAHSVPPPPGKPSDVSEMKEVMKQAEELLNIIKAAESLGALKSIWTAEDFQNSLKAVPDQAKKLIKEAKDTRRKELEAASA